jgi:ATP synthase protein I
MKEEERSTFSLASIGTEMVASVVLGLVVGIALDTWLGTEPWLLIVGLGLGIAAAFKPILALLNDDGQPKPDKERDGK